MLHVVHGVDHIRKLSAYGLRKTNPLGERREVHRMVHVTALSPKGESKSGGLRWLCAYALGWLCDSAAAVSLIVLALLMIASTRLAISTAWTLIRLAHALPNFSRVLSSTEHI